MTTMQDHSYSVTWYYVVPLHNSTRIVISQRTDGPFRKDEIGGKGHYYVSVEAIGSSGYFEHKRGSSSGGHGSFKEATLKAEHVWGELTKAL